MSYDLGVWEGQRPKSECPWSDSPLVSNATGPLFYFGVVFSRAETAREFAAQLAKLHGLVCFDRPLNKLR